MIDMTRTAIGPQFSRGSALLWECLTTRASQGALSREIGVPNGMLSRWLYGDRRPSWDRARRMRDVLGIPLEAWTELVSGFVPPAGRSDDDAA